MKPVRTSSVKERARAPCCSRSESRHAQVEGVAHEFLLDLSAPDLQLPCGLAEEIEEIVEEHPADDADDQDDVERRDPVDQGRVLLRSGHVHVPQGEPRVRAGMASGGAAGRREVGAVDPRGRVRGGEDVVGAVAARAVGDLDRAAARRQAVVAVGEGLQAVLRDVPFLRQLQRGVTRRADPGRDVGRGDGGARIPRRKDGVLPVAIGARRGVLVPLAQGGAVNAGGEEAVLGGVAPRADLLDLHLVDERGGVESAALVVSAVAIHAVGRAGIAAGERVAVNAVLEGGDESRGGGGAGLDRLVVEVTVQAEALLGPLQVHRGEAGAGRDRISVAGDTAGSGARPAREGLSVLGGKIMLAGLGVAVSAGLGLPGGSEPEGRVADRRDLVGPVAIRAGDLRFLFSAGRPGDLRMERVGRARPVVAGGAIDLVQAGLVREVRGLRQIRVAVDAGHARLAVNGGIEFRLGDEDGAAARALRVLVRVAGQTVVVARRLDRLRGVQDGPKRE